MGICCLLDIRNVRPARRPHERAAGREYLRVSKTSAYKLIERQKIPAIRIGRLLRVRKGEPGETLRAMGNDV